ncbi:hypothetical protein FHW89_005662, partial [Mucilaginibacter sp. SG564]|nr:hypothetical protein [Mucilaginibacter sp. SG564]
VIIYVAHNVLALFFKANSVTELVDLYNCERSVAIPDLQSGSAYRGLPRRSSSQ